MSRKKKITIAVLLSFVLTLSCLAYWSWSRSQAVEEAIKWVERHSGTVYYKYPEWSKSVPDNLKHLIPKKVMRVSCIGNNLSDISRFLHFIDLEQLDLSVTNVSDVSALKGLVKLKFLNLVDTEVSDISALKGLVQLKTLYLSGTKVSDSAIKSFTKNNPACKVLK
jgi:hypothetical protein